MTKKQPVALVTGVTGQTGSYLAELLLEKGYRVVGMKRRTSLIDAHKRLDHIYSNPNFTLVYGNLSDAGSLWRIIAEHRPDEVYNLGAMSHVRTSFEVSEETLDTVGMAPLRILNALKELCPKAKFYQASSSEMFGDAPIVGEALTEKSPMNPVSPYAAAKLFAHNITKNYREGYGMFACSGILLNHESPRRGETFVTRKITIAAARIKLGLQASVELGNIDAIRDWGYAKDYAVGMHAMLQQPKADDFLLATGEAHSVRDWLNAVFTLADIDWEGHITYNKRLHRPQEVPFLLGDYSKAKKTLGWEPKVKFHELARMMYLEDLKDQAEKNGLDWTKYAPQEYTTAPTR